MKKHLLGTLMLLSALFVLSTFSSDVNAATPAGRWKNVRNIWWFQYDTGGYAVNEYIDGCWMDNSGVYIPGWEGAWCCDNTGWWFQSGSWYPTNSWLKIDGYWYYFKGDGYMACEEWIGDYYLQKDGSMATNTWVDDRYYVDEVGKWNPERDKPAPENDKTNGTVPDDMKAAIAYSKDTNGIMSIYKFAQYFGFQQGKGGYYMDKMSIILLDSENPKLIQLNLANKSYKIECRTGSGDYDCGDYTLVKDDLLKVYYFITEQKTDGLEVMN